MRRRQFQSLFSEALIKRYSQTPGNISPGSGAVVNETEAEVAATDFVIADIESISGVDTDITVVARATSGGLRFSYLNTGAGAEDPGTVVVKVIILRPVEGLVEEDT